MFDTVECLTQEWLTDDRRDRLELERLEMGVVMVVHPLTTDDPEEAIDYTVQLQQDAMPHTEGDRIMTLYLSAPHIVEDYADAEALLKGTAIKFLLECGWYVVNYWKGSFLEVAIDG